ncbi:hypothetical protein E5329_08520 [Petralouisia muris]|jgi:hypothetical protein|uniref:Uncharacterized protein n=1 Tax=Petralouisia muris TaxID=3032872 RepID=A0AC61RXC7_9FIRM|nr:hypothetical protein [Petralouisia muris]TGY96599.1 hypothetical protein E5329_08520 [Petralouisia muris]
MMQNLYELGMDFLNKAFDDSFSNIEFFFLAYVLALAVFWFQKKQNLKSFFVYPALFAFFTVFNPYLMIPIADKIGLAPRIRRIYWLLPVNLVLAFATTWLVYALSKRWKQAIAVILCLIAAAFFGENQWAHMIPAENSFKIKNETIEIADIIEKDADTADPKSCLFADLQLLELRQYDPSLLNVIRRKDMADWPVNPADPDWVQRVLNKKNSRRILTLVLYYGLTIDPAVFEEYMEKHQIQYVIPNKDKGLREYFGNMGYELVGETENFEVFRVEQPHTAGFLGS